MGISKEQMNEALETEAFLSKLFGRLDVSKEAKKESEARFKEEDDKKYAEEHAEELAEKKENKLRNLLSSRDKVIPGKTNIIVTAKGNTAQTLNDFLVQEVIVDENGEMQIVSEARMPVLGVAKLLDNLGYDPEVSGDVNLIVNPDIWYQRDNAHIDKVIVEEEALRDKKHTFFNDPRDKDYATREQLRALKENGQQLSAEELVLLKDLDKRQLFEPNERQRLDIENLISKASSASNNTYDRWDAYNNLITLLDLLKDKGNTEVGQLSLMYNEVLEKYKDSIPADRVADINALVNDEKSRVTTFNNLLDKLRFDIRGRSRYLDQLGNAKKDFSTSSREDYERFLNRARALTNAEREYKKRDKRNTYLSNEIEKLIAKTQADDEAITRSNILKQRQDKGEVLTDDELKALLEPVAYDTLKEQHDTDLKLLSDLQKQKMVNANLLYDVLKAKDSNGDFPTAIAEVKEEAAKALLKSIYAGSSRESDQAIMSRYLDIIKDRANIMTELDKHTGERTDAELITSMKDYDDWLYGKLTNEDIIDKYGEQLGDDVIDADAVVQDRLIDQFLRKNVSRQNVNSSRSINKLLNKLSKAEIEQDVIHDLMIPVAGSVEEQDRKINALLQAEQYVADARERLNNAKWNVQQISSYVREGLASKEELDEAKQERDAAEEYYVAMQNNYANAKSDIKFTPKYDVTLPESEKASSTREFLDQLPSYNDFMRAFTRMNDLGMRKMYKQPRHPELSTGVTIEDAAQGLLSKDIDAKAKAKAAERVNKYGSTRLKDLLYAIKTGNASAFMSHTPEGKGLTDYRTIAGIGARQALDSYKEEILKLLPVKTAKLLRDTVQDTDNLYDLRGILNKLRRGKEYMQYKPEAGQTGTFDKLYKQVYKDLNTLSYHEDIPYAAQFDIKSPYYDVNHRQRLKRLKAISEHLGIPADELNTLLREGVSDDVKTKIIGDQKGNIRRSAIMEAYQKGDLGDRAKANVASRFEDAYAEQLAKLFPQEDGETEPSIENIIENIEPLKYTDPDRYVALITSLNARFPGLYDESAILDYFKRHGAEGRMRFLDNLEPNVKNTKQFFEGIYNNTDYFTKQEGFKTISDLWKQEIDSMPGDLSIPHEQLIKKVKEGKPLSQLEQDTIEKYQMLNKYKQLLNEAAAATLPNSEIFYDDNGMVDLVGDEQQASYAKPIKRAFDHNVFDYLSKEEEDRLYKELLKGPIDEELKNGGPEARARAVDQATYDYLDEIYNAMKEGINPEGSKANWRNMLSNNRSQAVHDFIEQQRREKIFSPTRLNVEPDSMADITGTGLDENTQSAVDKMTNSIVRRIKKVVQSNGENISKTQLKKLGKQMAEAGYGPGDVTKSDTVTSLKDKVKQATIKVKRKPDVQKAVEETKEAIAAQGTPFDKEETQEAVKAVEQVDPTLLDKYSVDSGDDTTDTVNLGAMAAHLQHETNPFEASNETTVYDTTKEEQKDK